jgi:hypothetical protein
MTHCGGLRLSIIIWRIGGGGEGSKFPFSSFNFGPSVCKWFELFYSKANSCVINNGHMSNFFSLERGCRQGDPLSPYLFIIGVELLSLKLKANQDIHGIIINEVESLISLYADDTFNLTCDHYL